MKQYDKYKALISLHLPKTGGRSLYFALEEWFPNQLYTHYIKGGTMPEKHAPEVAEPICIHGHFNRNRQAGAFQYYPEHQQYITLLRNPLKRQISYYNYSLYMINSGKIKKEGHPVLKYADINEFLENCRPNVLKFFPITMNQTNYKEIIDQQFVQILILENFQNSLNALAQKLGQKVIDVPHKNKAKQTYTPDEGVKKQFKKRVSFEYELYRYSMEHFGIKL